MQPERPRRQVRRISRLDPSLERQAIALLTLGTREARLQAMGVLATAYERHEARRLAGLDPDERGGDLDGGDLDADEDSVGAVPEECPPEG